MIHSADCPKAGGRRYFHRECRDFSTDGTALGAVIAHQMGTMDEDEIREIVAKENRNAAQQSLTGMEAEQADWDSSDLEFHI